MASNYLLVMKNGSADLETNLPEISGESIHDSKQLFVNRGICKDPYHECFGKQIYVFDGVWKGHVIHIEKIIEDNLFNVVLDGWRSRSSLSRDEMIDFIRNHYISLKDV